MQTLADLRAGIDGGSVPSPASTSILAFLDLTRAAIGADFQNPEVLSSEVELSRYLPHDPDAGLLAAFGDLPIYRRCRKSIVRHVRLAGMWDDDPYPLLNRIAKERGISGVNRRLIEELFAGLSLREITRERALCVDKRLRGSDRNAFRNSIATMDRLRLDPRVVASGFLGPNPVGRLPEYRDGNRVRVDLPANLAAASRSIRVSHARRARRAFELAVDIGILKETPSNGTWTMTDHAAGRYFTILKDSFSASTARLYLGALLALLSKADLQAVPADLTVDRICQPDRYRPKPAPAAKKDRQTVPLPPALRTEAACFAKARSLGDQRRKSLLRILCLLIEAGCSIEDPDLLDQANALLERDFSDHAPSTTRAYTSVLRGFLSHTGRLGGWDAAIARAKTLSSGDIDMRGLYLIRKLAETSRPPLPLAEIDAEAARALVHRARADGQTSRCIAGIRSLDGLRMRFPDVVPGPTLGDWEAHDTRKVPHDLEDALRTHAKDAGYTDLGIKARIMAVRKLHELTPDPSVFDAELECIPWNALIDDVIETSPKGIEPYRAELLRFANALQQVWTAGWSKLQACIVAAGIPRAENPIDALLDAASQAGLEPWELDRDWAWTHERSLRPDLRITWSRNIARFDALRRVPILAQNGFLPPASLGPMPARGARLKNAIYPLPDRLEAALKGKSKQVLEAAHFVWRCLKDLGIHARNDDPAPGEIVTERHLSRVRREQSVMTDTSAKLHLGRIRDWRESRIDLS